MKVKIQRGVSKHERVRKQTSSHNSLLNLKKALANFNFISIYLNNITNC